MRNTGIMVVFAALLLAFLAGLYETFRQRMEYGDVYGVYSTYRSDPKGARVLYEAIGRIPGIAVSRNLRNMIHIGSGEDTTILLAGVSDSDDPKRVLENVEAFVISGGRLVVTYDEDSFDWLAKKEEERRKRLEENAKKADEKKTEGEAKEPEKTDVKADVKAEEKKDAEGEDEDEDTKPDRKHFVNITERWGFAFDHSDFPKVGRKYAEVIDVARAPGNDALPEKLPWRCTAWFDKTAPEWTPVYLRDGHPVLIERHWGRGSMVIATDTYLLSNEAMRHDRYPALLSWILGSNHRVVFDETHLGLQEEPSIATLIRKYRLEGFFLTFVALAGLFVWKNLRGPLPRRDRSYEAETLHLETGKEAAAGLVNLLRRSVPEQKLLDICQKEWRHDFQRDRRYAPEVAQTLGTLARDEGAGSVPDRYAAMCRALKERK
jgi:hypothetical protein